MPTSTNQLTCEIELQPGEKFRLPPALLDSVGPGHWLVTITPLSPIATPEPIRSHTALLNSYVAEDEGLYDDYPAR
ncbi:MAG: hypothetical protein NTY19_49620 [Planctomycetota bacterium]|nr:hypothetical protein [Planctomycetota bacterium]